MTNEQLKAAIEEVRNLSGDVRDIEDGAPYATKTYITSMLHRTMQVAMAFQSHYLSQQAEDADGDEPVAYSWAKSLPNAIDQGGCCFFRCINDIELWVSDDEGVVLHRCGGELELEITTRRAMRQLLAALQIPTTKGTDQ